MTEPAASDLGARLVVEPVAWKESNGPAQVRRELRPGLLLSVVPALSIPRNLGQSPVLVALAVLLVIGGLLTPLLTPLMHRRERVVVTDDAVELWRRRTLRRRVERGAHLRAARYRLGRGDGESPQHLALADGRVGLQLTDPRWVPHHLTIARTAGVDPPLTDVSAVRRDLPECFSRAGHWMIAFGSPENRRWRIVAVAVLVVVTTTIILVARHRTGVR